MTSPGFTFVRGAALPGLALALSTLLACGPEPAGAGDDDDDTETEPTGTTASTPMTTAGMTAAETTAGGGEADAGSDDDGGGATVVVDAGTVVVDDGADGSVSADVNRAVPPHAASDVATRAHRPMVFIAAAVGKYFIRVSISGGVEVLMRGSTDVDTKCASICCIDDGVRASRHREC